MQVSLRQQERHTFSFSSMLSLSSCLLRWVFRAFWNLFIKGWMVINVINVKHTQSKFYGDRCLNMYPHSKCNDNKIR